MASWLPDLIRADIFMRVFNPMVGSGDAKRIRCISWHARQVGLVDQTPMVENAGNCR